MRGVTVLLAVVGQRRHISTRTPHAGSDMFIVALNLAVTIFQPALPMRGVTCQWFQYSPSPLFQPALPMRGVTWAETVVL